MPPAPVGLLATAVNTTPAVSTIVLTPSHNAGAGNFLQLAANPSGGKTIASVFDTIGNTWTIQNGVGTGSNPSGAFTNQDRGPLTTGDSVTVTFNGTGGNKVALIFEFSGVDDTPRDQTGNNTDGSTSPAVVVPGGGASTRLVVGMFAWQTASAQRTFAAAAPYVSVETDENSSVNAGIALAYQVAAASTFTISGTLSGTVSSGAQIAATYKPAASQSPAPAGSIRTTFAVDAQNLLDYQNAGQQRVCAETRLLTKRTSLVLVPGQQEYALGADLVRLLGVSDGTTLIPTVTVDVAMRLLSDPDAALIGVLQHYLIGHRIGFIPKPDAVKTYQLYYQARPAVMTSDDELEAIGDYARLVDRLANAYMLEDDGQPELAQSETAFYQREAARLLRRDRHERRQQAAVLGWTEVL